MWATKADCLLPGDAPPPKTPASAPSVSRHLPVSPEIAVNVGPARLVGLDGPLRDVEFPLDRPETRIGRQADCDIALANENVSRFHSLIRHTPTGLEIVDMGSANGTWVNGVKVATACPLADRDIIRIGQANFTVRLGAPPAPPHLVAPSPWLPTPGKGPAPLLLE